MLWKQEELDELGPTLRSAVEAETQYEINHCGHCEKRFNLKRRHGKFCSVRCRVASFRGTALEPQTRRCSQCNRSFIRTREWQRFCGADCRNAFHAE